MTSRFRYRLVFLCGAAFALVAMLAWSATSAWTDLNALRRRLTVSAFESFHIADELESHMISVNSSLLAAALGSDDAAWLRYEEKSNQLNAWIDLQRGVLSTAQEKRVLDAVDSEYNHYLAVAEDIRRQTGQRTFSAVAGVRQLDTAAERMFALARQLAEAHRSALGDFFAASQRSIQKLEGFFGVSLALLLLVGAWGIRQIFLETVAPLRRQLVETQELAERHEKLASLGVLAAGVAHEIRNPLTALKTRAFTLRRKLAPSDSALADAAIIDQEIERLERIVGDFLLFARPGDPQFAVVAPHALLSAVGELLAPELAQNDIALTIDPAADAAAIRVDPQQLKQVLINLIRNAAESIGQEGTITLRARSDWLPLRGRPQEVLVLEVQDTGTGIPPEIQKRLFDPFFTTKSAGTGLGLSIAVRILERHGGSLQFQTTPGRGTTFGVVLPMLPPAVHASVAEASPAAA